VPIPEISFVDNLAFTFGSLRDSGDSDENQEQWQDDTGTLTGFPTFVFNTLNRVTVVFAPLVFCFSRAQQVLNGLGTMSEGHDAPPTCSQANT